MKENVKTKLMTGWRIIVAIGMVSITLALFVESIYNREKIKGGSNRTWAEACEYSD